MVLQSDCCGEGCVEVKCSFCIKDAVIEEGFNKKGFCLTKNDLGQTQPSRDHAYYYQVQSQINMCMQASYGDFNVWSESIKLKGYCLTKFSGMNW